MSEDSPQTDSLEPAPLARPPRADGARFLCDGADLKDLTGRRSFRFDLGFAQGPFTRRVHPSIQWAKLSSLVEGARLASADLWKGK